MYARFVPEHYRQDLFNKLQNLKQSSKSVEEYYKDMEVTLKRADVHELEEQTIARFLNGLSPSINKIVDFQPYKNLVKLLHQATKAERHVQADQRTRAYYASKHEADKSAPSVPTQVRNSSMATKNSSSTKTLPNVRRQGTHVLRVYQLKGHAHG